MIAVLSAFVLGLSALAGEVQFSSKAKTFPRALLTGDLLDVVLEGGEGTSAHATLLDEVWAYWCSDYASFLATWDDEEEYDEDRVPGRTREYLLREQIDPESISAWISGLEVPRKLRGREIGRRAVLVFETWAAECGAKYVFLRAGQLDGPHSIGFWRHMGYRPLEATRYDRTDEDVILVKSL
jgi:GNAT superfamily N-acetyltransferase